MVSSSALASRFVPGKGGNVRLTGLKLLLAAITTLGFCINGSPASARLFLSYDKTLDKVGNWTLGYGNELGGCFASAPYEDQTTVWFGFKGNVNNAFIAFTNPKWTVIKPDSKYKLRLEMGRMNWNGDFTGFIRNGVQGLYFTNLKTEFLSDLAASNGVRVIVGNTRLIGLRLDGSRRALQTLIQCQQIHGGIAPTAPSQGQPVAPAAPRRSSSGTGFFVSANGDVVTNQHVISGCTNIRVTPVGGQETSAIVTAQDKNNDLALLRTTLKPGKVPALRPQARLGEPAYVFGYPLAGMLSTSGNFTIGAVTATTGLNDDTRMLQISAPVQPGNSGGPLIDKYGNVIGVIVSKLNAMTVAAKTNDIPQNVNFAIKSSIASTFLDSGNVTLTETPSTRELSPEAVADVAKLFTVQVNCN